MAACFKKSQEYHHDTNAAVVSRGAFSELEASGKNQREALPHFALNHEHNLTTKTICWTEGQTQMRIPTALTKELHMTFSQLEENNMVRRKKLFNL